MEKLTGNEVRSMFLEYFREHGHMVEPGASLIPHNDPTLLWINAGVAALKKYFDGTVKPKSNRITNAQKSIRTNDIENVGKTARHHTFFEMLGNFSIGDYFKKEAIPFAWEFLTSPDWIGFDKDRLYITVYPDDTEAYRIWTEVCGVDPKHILKSPDNFWEIGEGPSGPDTEIYYDRGEKYDPRHLGEELFFKEMENDRYIEVWNIVFSQYDAKEGVDRKDYKELPQKNIDTGMGLERLVCLIQDGETNFDTDLFLPIIHAAEQYAPKKYEGENKMAYRVIADHIRTVTFAIADGAMFGNTGRGYILRRVLRRAVRYGKKLGIEGAFMYHLVPVVAEVMNDYYPYLEGKVPLIEKLVKAEEESFEATLQEGERILQGYLAGCSDKTMKGEDAFKLYDTYGFPVELTKEIAGESGIKVDMRGFDAEMAKQKERARKARGHEQSMGSQSKDLMDFNEPSRFVGYEADECDGKVIGLFADGKSVSELIGEGEVVFDQTPFYAESGGQVADTGVMTGAGASIAVLDVKKAPHKQFLHKVDTAAPIRIGQTYHLSIDTERRTRIRANHSSLHLLQAALRKVLGTHVQQAGSYVCGDYGRFDFTHFEKPSEDQLHKVEEIVNGFIYHHYPVATEIMDIEKAKQTGAMALFDEKYEDRVRVVTMGPASKEFCAGTHVANTGDIGVFVIESEESIGSGIRRITCRTGLAAYHYLKAQQDLLSAVAQDLDLNSTAALREKTDQLIEELAAQRRANAELSARLSASQAAELAARAEEYAGKQYLLMDVQDADPAKLKDLAADLIKKMKDGFVFIADAVGGKAVFVCAAAPAQIALGHKAGDIVKKAAVLAGGNGGGRPDMAQAGGKDPAKISAVLGAVREMLGIPEVK